MSRIRIQRISGDKGFFGASVCEDDLVISMPSSFILDSEGSEDYLNLNDNVKKEILNYLRSLYLGKESLEENNARGDILGSQEGVSLIDSYMWIIEDFLKNGMPFRQQEILRLNGSGRIDWKRTIQKHIPFNKNGTLVYNGLITRSKVFCDDQIMRAYRECVSRSVRVLGWFYNLDDTIFEYNDLSSNEVQVCISVLLHALSTTFDDSYYLRLTHMINILSSKDRDAIDSDKFYGLDRYHYVFEKMVREVFGNKDPSDYYPHAYYIIDGVVKNQDPLRPDCIYQYDSGVVIMDAKYYTNKMPGADDIQKQITYGERLEAMKIEKKSIRNIFILPSQSGEILEYRGYAKTDWSKKPYSIVHVL